MKFIFVVLSVVFITVVASKDLEKGQEKEAECRIGEKRRIGKGSYFEKCQPKFETAGCYANWRKEEGKDFVEPGEFANRMYRNNSVGFRYQCNMEKGYISFAPVGCVLNNKNGLEHLKLDADGKMDDGQTVRCKKNNDGEFSFEFINESTEQDS